MSRTHSAIMTAAEKKDHIADLKAALKALKADLKAAEQEVKLTTKEIQKTEAKLAKLTGASKAQLPRNAVAGGEAAPL